MKTFLVVLRETHTNVATVTLDEAIEEATAERAAKLARDWRQSGDLERVGHHDARVEEATAWEMGSPCDLRPNRWGTNDILECRTHPAGIASKGMTKCYDADAYESEAPL